MYSEEEILKQFDKDLEERNKKIIGEDKMNEFLISADFYEQKELSEIERIRRGYEKALPNDFLGDTIVANKIEIFMISKDKNSKNGKKYHSNNNVTKIYIDNEELSVSFFDEFFDNYNKETDILKVWGENPIVKLLQILTNNPNKNRFEIKYEPFKKALEKINAIKLYINSYEQNGFEKYTFEVLGYSEE